MTAKPTQKLHYVKMRYQEGSNVPEWATISFFTSLLSLGINCVSSARAAVLPAINNPDQRLITKQ